MKARGAASLVISCVALAPLARADAPPEQQLSIAAFEEGRRLLEAGDCAHAIPKLKESIGHYPSIGARLSLAECYETAEPLAAWRQLKEAELLAFTRQDDRGAVARARAASLEPRLAMLRIELASAWDEAHTQVRIDASTLERFFRAGGPVAVEPGARVVEVAAPQKKTWVRSVTATLGSVVDVQIPPPEDGEAVAAPVAAPPPPPPSDAGTTQRTLGLALGAAGIAGLAVGAVTGLFAASKKSDLETKCSVNHGSFPSDCGGGSLSAPGDQDALRSEKTSLDRLTTASTIGFALGAAALTGGAALFLTAPRGAPAAALSVAPRGAGLVLTRAF
jgi:serine/threonine-protein kinase